MQHAATAEVISAPRRDGKPFAPFPRKDSVRVLVIRPSERPMLPTYVRLRENREFRQIYARGRSYANAVAVLYVMRRTGDYMRVAPGLRIGFVVSKKQGGAVIRNKIKRRLREAVRRILPTLIEQPSDVIFVGRSMAQTIAWSELQAAVTDLLKRAVLLDKTAIPAQGSESDRPAGE